MNAPADTPLAQAVIAQAVQGLESTGWLDDAGALRQAAREKPGERPAQYLRRAWLLGERLGLTQALEQARAAAGADLARMLRENSATTKEMQIGRLNVIVNAQGAVVRVTCG